MNGVAQSVLHGFFGPSICSISLANTYTTVHRCSNPLFQAEEDDDIGLGDSQAAMLEAKIDPIEWKRELERVGPRLKVSERRRFS